MNWVEVVEKASWPANTAVLLAGVAVTMLRLPQAAERRVLLFFLLPAFVLLGLAQTAAMFVRDDWVLLGICTSLIALFWAMARGRDKSPFGRGS